MVRACSEQSEAFVKVSSSTKTAFLRSSFCSDSKLRAISVRLAVTPSHLSLPLPLSSIFLHWLSLAWCSSSKKQAWSISTTANQKLQNMKINPIESQIHNQDLQLNINFNKKLQLIKKSKGKMPGKKKNPQNTLIINSKPRNWQFRLTKKIVH